MTIPWREALDKATRKDLWLAGLGCFSQVVRVGDTGLVVKKSEPHPVVGDLQPVEKLIYERLGHHQFILRYYGEYHANTETPNGVPGGLVFQYLPGGKLAASLPLSGYSEKRVGWAIQAAEAVQYIHSKSVIHSDLGSHNFLIREDRTLALADFGGSRIDDISQKVSYATRYQRPLPSNELDLMCTRKDDIFALGTVIYEITAGHQLYPDKQSGDIRQLLLCRKFPNLEAIVSSIRTVIRK
ncbi:serine/threonine protein kinase [Helicocarpus griseus UAMH5409]|uniref:Serine/threonine protein kinase n=1 Tax=Helicocarpus griseus UAMH5409 TaxID=1447875 RepID=A0A2B7XJQ0_9EURO|nr:serine/threonine protein kinase [Helicocarpus griseus UAMH5409]